MRFYSLPGRIRHLRILGSGLAVESASVALIFYSVRFGLLEKMTFYVTVV
jgi:hypothetical protein